MRSDPARGRLAEGVARTSGVACGKAPGFTVTGRAWAAAGRSLAFASEGLDRLRKVRSQALSQDPRVGRCQRSEGRDT